MPKPLIIGIDIRDLRIAKTGTKTYLEELCNEFKKMNTNDLCFYFFDTSFPVYTGSNVILKWIEHVNYQLWKQFILPVKAWLKNCDIIFCVDNFVPIIHFGYTTIPVFHDAFFFETPENYGKLWLKLYKILAIPAAKKSPFIVVPSAYTKKRIIYFTQISPDKLIVIPEGPKTLYLDTSLDVSDQILDTYSLLPANYILHVGSMFKRKNLPNLIKAFKKIKDSGYSTLKLVLAGPMPSTKNDTDFELILAVIESENLKDDVVLTGYLSDMELAQLYKNALIYIFPSINEGFGIPILEAFKYNLPVLVADNTCLPEVGGNAVIQFNPFDYNNIFYAIKTVLDNSTLQAKMIKNGQKRLEEFSWQKTALQLVDVFKKV